MKSDHKLNILTDEAHINADAPSPIAKTHGDERSLAVELDVVSDVICPWCFVGKRRLERAIALLGPDAQINATWRPFQLNPSIPKEGMDRLAYIRTKFRSVERYEAMQERLLAVGGSEGINFRFDRITRIPNTLDAHRLIWFGQRHRNQDAVVEALFNAYFVDGMDVGEQTNLVSVAASAGIKESLAEEFLASDEGLNEVLAEERKFKALGINGVPSFVINGVVLFSEAAEPGVLATTFREAR